MQQLWFRTRTLRFRHREAFEFFLINVLLQLLPLAVAALERITNGTTFDLIQQVEAAWVLLAFGLWNAPAAIRRNVINREKSIRIRFAFYSVAFAVTVIIFWILFDRSDQKPTAAASSAAYLILPLGLATLACGLIGAINYNLLKPTSIRLLWNHQSQFSGIYVAKYFGHFADQGLRVAIKPADPRTAHSALDHFGGCNFAIVSSTDVVRARNSNIKMRAIQVIVPEPAIVFMVREESSMHSFADFRGKRVAYRKGYEEADLLKIMLHSVGLSLTDVEPVDASAACEEFVEGKADVVAGHEAIEPRALAHKQVFVRKLHPTLDGHPVFADTLVTTEQIIRVVPELVRAMSRAVANGWNDVTEHPERGIEATLHEQGDYSAANREFQSEIQDAMLGLRGGSRILPIGLLPFGAKESDWAPIIRGMESAGVTRPGLRASEMYWF